MSALEQALGGSEIEVVAKATRRRFTVEYKRKIVRGLRSSTTRRRAGGRAHCCLCRASRTIPRRPASPASGSVEVWINPPKTRATEETRGLVATRGDVLDHVRPGKLISAHHSDLHQRGCMEAPA